LLIEFSNLFGSCLVHGYPNFILFGGNFPNDGRFPNNLGLQEADVEGITTLCDSGVITSDVCSVSLFEFLQTFKIVKGFIRYFT